MFSRVVLAAALSIVTGIVHAIVGPSRTRRVYMGTGTVGGLAAGIVFSSFVPRFASDIVIPFAIVGIFAGWAVAWTFVRRVPRTAK